jgi:branched-subunit amino acid transport protein
MEIRPEIALLVFACALVTMVPRVLPLVVLSRVQLPSRVAQWLGYVPIAVLAALLSLELLATGWHGVAAIVPALMVAVLTESLFATVVIGVMAYAFMPLML